MESDGAARTRDQASLVRNRVVEVRVSHCRLYGLVWGSLNGTPVTSRWSTTALHEALSC